MCSVEVDERFQVGQVCSQIRSECKTFEGVYSDEDSVLRSLLSR